MLKLQKIFYIRCIKDRKTVETRLSKAEFVEYMNSLTADDIDGIDHLSITSDKLPVLHNKLNIDFPIDRMV